MFEGFGIVPPISPWDEKHREIIEMDMARRTVGATEAEAWRIWVVRPGSGILTPGEVSRRIQFWHDRGYRVKPIRIEFTNPTP
jgi:hypothetical protein